MGKRIIVCADGTWNCPEKDLKNDFPSNVLKLARAIRPLAPDKKPQQVFYDWGIGSYYDPLIGGITGKGLHKNIMDGYRYIIQNYAPGDEIYLFGFSRGAYTIRCLCGLINNCGILRRPDAALVQLAFNHYKRAGQAYAPSGKESLSFRKKHAHPSREIHFVGVWDTVGAMGIPISFLGFFEDKDEFYDTKIGKNVICARHALAIDEYRSDFEPTIWTAGENSDVRQVWFSGAHCNIGGSYKPDKDGSQLSDISLAWMINEAAGQGLGVENYLSKRLRGNPLATLHSSRRSFYRIRQKYYREIDHRQGEVLIHWSVKARWDQDPAYRPLNLRNYIAAKGWPNRFVS